MLSRCGCRCILLVVILGACFTFIDAGTKRRICLSNEVRCPSGIAECIINTKICNGVRDCSDGSDERASLCATYDCTNKNYEPNSEPRIEVPYFMTKRCPSKKMCTKDPVFEYNPEEENFLTFFTCNGGPSRCADKSDQDPKFCRGIDCKAEPFGLEAENCPSGNYCLYPFDYSGGDNARDSLCDGVKHCPDGSDEWPSFCKANGCSFRASQELQCQNGKCLRPEDVCNGIKDCSKGEDEDAAFCRTYTCSSFRGDGKCPDNRTCIANSQYCNGKRDCSDGSDENPAVCRARPCADGEWRCKDGLRCIDPFRRCDGKKDCRDGSDEEINFCKNQTCFKCPNGRECTFSEYAFCNGRRDCSDGSDERASFCKSFKCPYGRVKCGERLCVSGFLCDGRVDCDDGSDESPSLCPSYKCPAGSAKCPGFRNQCLGTNLFCNGRRDCVDGSDEDPTFCRTYKCPDFYVNCNGLCKLYQC